MVNNGENSVFACENVLLLEEEHGNQGNSKVSSRLKKE
jgi:hypothetical protein